MFAVNNKPKRISGSVEMDGFDTATVSLDMCVQSTSIPLSLDVRVIATSLSLDRPASLIVHRSHHCASNSASCIASTSPASPAHLPACK